MHADRCVRESMVGTTVFLLLCNFLIIQYQVIVSAMLCYIMNVIVAHCVNPLKGVYISVKHD